MRLCYAAPVVPALIFQFCPMVIPAPGKIDDSNPSEWCRPLQGPPGYGALINGDPASAERVWANRSLRPISDKEYAYRMGPLRDWARTNPEMPEARPDQPVDLAALPPLF